MAPATASPAKSDSIKRWKRLTFSGFFFPPTPTPGSGTITVRANGKAIDISPAAKASAWLMRCYQTRQRADATFIKNFEKDWNAMLPASLRPLRWSAVTVTTNTCNAMKPPTRPAACTAKVDGHIESIACGIEGMGIFVGRGPQHPLRGRIRKGVAPEDVTINASPGLAPKPPPGHRWRAVVHETDAWWVAKWTDSVTGKTKYVWLDRTSAHRGTLDLSKFESARRLARQSSAVREKITRLTKRNPPDSRAARTGAVLWLVHALAIRIGTDRASDRTVGACTLQKHHVSLGSRAGAHTLTLDFPGKDSIRYSRAVKVPSDVASIIRSALLHARQPSDRVFHDVTAADVNTWLRDNTSSSNTPKITAKTIRTAAANVRYQALLQQAQTLDDLKSARLSVAELCNHRKSSKNDSSTEVTTTTTINNYLDPRITVAWAKKHDVDLKRVFSKKQLQTFAWAMNAPATFVF